MTELPPVEYAVAVDRYLSDAGLAPGSRRIYRIALDTWAWALADRPAPTGPGRRRARPPVLPLALLDHPDAAGRLRTAVELRTTATDPRTLNRELSTLRAAVVWWRARGWLVGDPTTDLRPRPPVGPAAAPLTPDELRALFALRAPLREQALWHLLHESGAAIETVLALDADDLDLPHRRTLHRPGRTPLHWQAGTARLLPLLVAGRTTGPLFLTDRRAPAGTPAADRCPLTGRARLSYRRAAELLATHSRPLTTPPDPAWTLRRLRRS
ncbi:hypothetical protein ACFYUY_19740 [Kitasatospora sp. NPDC004745]|uniref:hypothetical protein n=1 Tax=Kitasatospora sp. NPDC004745 TaxID=3364019 RepID=UPI003685337F